MDAPVLAPKVSAWALPAGLDAFQAYGLWNCLLAYDPAGKLLEIIPAHDGDFFPESPLDDVEALRAGAVEEAWPVRVDIDITQNCTDRCFFCYSRPYTGKAAYHEARIPAGTFDALLAELAGRGTRTVRFTGGGEPLEHPEIREMLAMPHAHGLKTCLITNGSLLDDEIDALLVEHVDQVRLSVNAGTEETRRALHRSRVPHAGLAHLHAHLRHIVSLRAARFPGQRRPSIWTTFLILPHNRREVAQAARDLRDCGADSVSFRPVYHEFYRGLDPADQSDLADQLEAARALHNPPAFQVFTPRRGLIEAGRLAPADYFDECLSCHLRTVVEAALPHPLLKTCGLYRGEEDGRLGALEGDFAAAWQSPEARAELSQRPARCVTCIDVSMNTTLSAMRRVLRACPEAVFRRGWQAGKKKE